MRRSWVISFGLVSAAVLGVAGYVTFVPGAMSMLGIATTNPAEMAQLEKTLARLENEIARKQSLPEREDDAPIEGAPKPTTAAPASKPAHARLAPAERGKLLAHLPSSTLAAVRVPRFSELKSALLQSKVLPGLAASLPAEVRMWLSPEGIASAVPDLSPQEQAVLGMVEALSQVQGEVVAGVVGEAPSKDHKNALGLSVALFADVSNAEAQFRGLAESMASKQRADASYALETSVENGVLGVVIGERGAPPRLAAWRAMPPKQSFLTDPVVHGAPSTLEGSLASTFELFVDFDIIGKSIPGMPKELDAILASSGLTSFQGLSLVLAGNNGGFAEQVTVHGEGENVLSRLYSTTSIDSSWAHWVIPDANAGSILLLPVGKLYSEIAGLMPPQQQQQIQNALHSMRERLALDLRGDLIELLGPHVVISTHKLAPKKGAAGPGVGVAVAIEVRKADRVKSAVDGMLKAFGVAGSRRTQNVKGVGEVSMLVPGGPVGELPSGVEPCFTITDQALVVASSLETLKRVILAQRDALTGVGAVVAREAADSPEGTFVVSVTDTNAQLQQFMTAMQSKPQGAGVSFLNEAPAAAEPSVVRGMMRDGSLLMRAKSQSLPALCGGVFVGAGAGLSLAIPKFLASRIDANETSAIQQLQSIHKAEQLFRDNQIVDEDGDGKGEYGWIGELAGAIPLRGTTSKLEPPLLQIDAAQLTGTAWRHNGYEFRVDLPSGDGQFNGASGRVNADGAEQHYVAYAWPVRQSSTGRRVFCIDENGDVYASDNVGPQQRYSGLDRPPRADSGLARPSLRSGAELGSYRSARDGALWERLAR